MDAISRPEPNQLHTRALRLLLLAAAASVLLIVRAVPPAEHVEIPGLSNQALDELGVEFLPPDGEPAVDADDARLAAISQVPTFDLPISNTVLVRMVDPNSGIDQLVWVNRIDITGHPLFVSSGNYIEPNLLPTGPWTPEDSQSRPEVATREPRPPQTYYLIFVDATTGEVLYAVYG